MTFVPALVAAAWLVSPAAARAQDDDDNATKTEEIKETTVGNGTPSRDLPPPKSTNQPQPPVAAPQIPHGGVVHQAGVGGPTAYGRAGVLELGGSANFTKATDFTQFTLNPSFGWYFMDNVEASAILGFSHISAQGVEANFFTALAEPSVHIPFSDTLFGFLGAGVGLSWVDGPGAGLAFAPRLGLNILVGRSGILTPQVSLQYSTTSAISTPQGTLLAVSATYGAGLGYTVMW